MTVTKGSWVDTPIDLYNSCCLDLSQNYSDKEKLNLVAMPLRKIQVNTPNYQNILSKIIQ